MQSPYFSRVGDRFRHRTFAGLSSRFEIRGCLTEDRGVPGSSPGLATGKEPAIAGFFFALTASREAGRVPEIAACPERCRAPDARSPVRVENELAAAWETRRHGVA
jgi:hypothetical protein